MIPRRLHYCWFGGAEKPDLVQFCIRSWHEHCPDYEIVEWNEENFCLNAFPTAAAAYKMKRYAFVSDIAQAYALHTEGGIYVDADVEIRRNLDRFLVHSAFTGFEVVGFPFTALWGCVKGHKLAKMMVDYYSTTDAGHVIGVPNVCFVTDFLVRHFGVDPNCDELQNCADGLVVYPSHIFCVNLPPNYAAHHFAGTWLQKEITPRYSDTVLATFYMDALRKLHLMGIEALGGDRRQLKWHADNIYRLAKRSLARRMRGVFKVRFPTRGIKPQQ